MSIEQRQRFAPKTSTSSSRVYLSTSTTASFGQSNFNVAPVTSRDVTERAKAMEKAVFNYLRAIRALGRTTAHTVEIAQALEVSEGEVLAILPALAQKGVRIAS